MVAATALNNPGIERLPLRQFLEVVLKLRTSLCQCDAVVIVYRDEIGKEEGVHSHTLIVGMYGYEHQIDLALVLPLERAQEMKPPHRQQFATRLVQCMREAVGGDGYTYEPAVAVFHSSEQTRIHNGDVLLEKILYLTV